MFSSKSKIFSKKAKLVELGGKGSDGRQGVSTGFLTLDGV
jgi:hypothetical protein